MSSQDPGRLDPMPTINISKMPVGANIGGLVFVVGCIAVMVVGLEEVRMFLAAASVAGIGLAIVLVSWHRRRSRKEPPNRALGIDH
jgi:hypothetical protein